MTCERLEEAAARFERHALVVAAAIAHLVVSVAVIDRIP